MCNIGGIRPQEGVYVRDAQMIICGCPTSHHAMFRLQGTHRSWMCRWPFSKAGNSTGMNIRIMICLSGLIKVSSLYDHCVKAVEYGLQFGAHGLPLMGAGDWNDGMDRVGSEGNGESVWLAWFLCDTIQKFSEVATLRLDHSLTDRYRSTARDVERKY